MRNVYGFFVVFVLALTAPVHAREVAITIDDLPRGGDGGDSSLEGVLAMTEKLLVPFREQRIPVTGFVNEGRLAALGPAGVRALLEVWLDAGAQLGNHTYSHPDINRVPLEDYTADIARGEPVLAAALAARGRTLRYFRHPFLRTGPTPQIKAGMQAFLEGKGYIVAPVTFDNSDYMYARLYNSTEHRERVLREYVPYMESVIAFFEARGEEVVGRDFPQILLLHANDLNADTMPALLAMLRRRGYDFVTLERALADEAYSQPEEYAGPGGFSWIHRWSRTKGMLAKGEPEPPDWVIAAFTAPNAAQ